MNNNIQQEDLRLSPRVISIIYSLYLTTFESIYTFVTRTWVGSIATTFGQWSIDNDLLEEHCIAHPDYPVRPIHNKVEILNQTVRNPGVMIDSPLSIQRINDTLPLWLRPNFTLTYLEIHSFNTTSRHPGQFDGAIQYSRDFSPTVSTLSFLTGYNIATIIMIKTNILLRFYRIIESGQPMSSGYRTSPQGLLSPLNKLLKCGQKALNLYDLKDPAQEFELCQRFIDPVLSADAENGVLLCCFCIVKVHMIRADMLISEDFWFTTIKDKNAIMIF
ncbi:hypothetical protein BDA99DRAFT_535825 [Phascolomyces articulosus]|uniref:Uncharacterized protein n=1 Tax=Phascolomyces articulosus TaxID=60185 RepID=A0AAD5K408_9FUNG|nr:hypothetical protein BDA99DRAFT_535825 [Phascolomyces articulosus]